MHAKIKFGTIILLIAGALAPVAASAGQFGNPTNIGEPGSVELSVGGGKSSNLSLDSEPATVVTKVGNLTSSNVAPASSGTFKEDLVTAGLSYTINSRVQVFANLGSGKDTGQKSNSYALGFKFLPIQDAGSIKMGLMVRAQKVKLDVTGMFLPYPYNSATDGVNTASFYQPINGTESLQYTRFDLFLGASADTKTFRPYGGLALSRLSGTDGIALAGNATVSTCPNAGGACTFATQAVSINSTSNVSATRMFSVVAGVELNPEGPVGMTLEARTGVEKMISLTGNFRF